MTNKQKKLLNKIIKEEVSKMLREFEDDNFDELKNLITALSQEKFSEDIDDLLYDSVGEPILEAFGEGSEIVEQVAELLDQIRMFSIKNLKKVEQLLDKEVKTVLKSKHDG